MATTQQACTYRADGSVVCGPDPEISACQGARYEAMSCPVMPAPEKGGLLSPAGSHAPDVQPFDGDYAVFGSWA